MSQVFKYVVPLSILTELLDKICEPGQEYIIDNNVYKRMKFHGYHTPFLEALVPYYHWSKRFYVERECSYTSFMTIVRQICRIHDTEIRSTIQYGDSTYAIAYVVAKGSSEVESSEVESSEVESSEVESSEIPR